MRKPLTIADKKHRIVICSMHDIAQDGDFYRLLREGIYSGWAAIEPKRASTFAPNGSTIRESRDVPTHRIRMNFRSDVDISSAAWAYEERRKSPPRWFKITQVIEDSANSELVYECRLVERAEEASQPVAVQDSPENVFSGVPQGVRT